MAINDNAAYWKMDEAGGVRWDSIAGSDLADNFTVLWMAGKHGNAADFEADNGEFLSKADCVALSMGDIDCEWSGWVRLETASGGAMIIFGKWAGEGDYEYMLYYSSGTPCLRWQVSSTGLAANITGISETTQGGLTPGTWYWVDVFHDAVADEIGISVNRGPFDIAPHVGGIADRGSAFYFGKNQQSGIQWWDGGMDEWLVRKSLFTTAERASVYNGGVGQTHPLVDIDFGQRVRWFT